MHTAKIAAPATLLALTISSWAQDELQFATTMGETLSMVYVEGGEFLMGAQNTNPQGENYYAEAQQDESPAHREQLPSFYISKYEVTLGLWGDIMGGDVPYGEEQMAKGGVSFVEAQDFVTRLNETFADKLPGGASFALPTEQQWEYAARGGTRHDTYAFSGGDVATEVAQFGGATEKPGEVGKKRANSLGLHDMSGNAQEWTQSDYVGYDGTSLLRLTYRAKVLRGGGIQSQYERQVSVSARAYFAETTGMQYHGLRPVLNIRPDALEQPDADRQDAAPRLVKWRKGVAVRMPSGDVLDLWGRKIN